MIACKQCPETRASLRQMQAHVAGAHAKPLKRCRLCGAIDFCKCRAVRKTTVNGMAKARRIGQNEKPMVRCDSCGRILGNREERRKHACVNGPEVLP